jgi:hypothetical protein
MTTLPKIKGGIILKSPEETRQLLVQWIDTASKVKLDFLLRDVISFEIKARNSAAGIPQQYSAPNLQRPRPPIPDLPLIDRHKLSCQESDYIYAKLAVIERDSRDFWGLRDQLCRELQITQRQISRVLESRRYKTRKRPQSRIRAISRFA